MASTDLVLRETPAEGVAVIRLNRPDKRNALNIPLVEGLCAALDHANLDEKTRVIVLRGAGDVFCAGLDLKEAADPANSHRSATLVARLLESVAASPKVTIAAVHGAAIAGGAGLMAACDLVVAASGARIGFPEVRRGLVAGLVMTFVRRQVPDRFARELLLLGETIEAERAGEIGLVTRVSPTDLLDETVDLFVDQALKGAPEAIALTKEFYAGLAPSSVSADLERALDLHVRARNSEDAREGMQAFLEKRPPRWHA